MDALVLTTFLFNFIGTAVMALGAVLASCLPGRRRVRTWVADTDAGTRSAAVPAAMQPAVEVELPRAA